MGIYMKFGNIVGDATQHVQNGTGVASQILHMVAGNSIAAAILGETGWIPLREFHWHGQRTITNRAGKGSASQARGPVSPNLDEVTVEKDVDGASCDLFQSFCEDTKGVDCTIVFIRTGDPGEIYLKYKLKNALIQDIHVSLQHSDAGRGGTAPCEPRRRRRGLTRFGTQQHPIRRFRFRRIGQCAQRDVDRPFGALQDQALKRAPGAGNDIMPTGGA
jgi:type VI protein secretion system component Hcp